jgi:hypothetical protein
MIHSSSDWEKTFSALFGVAVKKYEQGHHQASDLVDADGATFLKSIGHTGQEFFDFVEDFAKGGEPSLETALEIAAVRRDYFLKEQKGIFSSTRISMDTLPSKDAEVDGIGWLPRIIPKAEAKLRGEMPPELMYSCGGDRKFFRNNKVDPAEFLRQTWKAHGDHGKIVAWVKGLRPAQK